MADPFASGLVASTDSTSDPFAGGLVTDKAAKADPFSSGLATGEGPGLTDTDREAIAMGSAMQTREADIRQFLSKVQKLSYPHKDWNSAPLIFSDPDIQQTRADAYLKGVPGVPSAADVNAANPSAPPLPEDEVSTELSSPDRPGFVFVPDDKSQWAAAEKAQRTPICENNLTSLIAPTSCVREPDINTQALSVAQDLVPPIAGVKDLVQGDYSSAGSTAKTLVLAGAEATPLLGAVVHEAREASGGIQDVLADKFPGTFHPRVERTPRLPTALSSLFDALGTPQRLMIAAAEAASGDRPLERWWTTLGRSIPFPSWHPGSKPRDAFEYARGFLKEQGYNPDSAASTATCFLYAALADPMLVVGWGSKGASVPRIALEQGDKIVAQVVKTLGLDAAEHLPAFRAAAVDRLFPAFDEAGARIPGATTIAPKDIASGVRRMVPSAPKAPERLTAAADSARVAAQQAKGTPFSAELGQEASTAQDAVSRFGTGKPIPSQSEVKDRLVAAAKESLPQHVAERVEAQLDKMGENLGKRGLTLSAPIPFGGKLLGGVPELEVVPRSAATSVADATMSALDKVHLPNKPSFAWYLRKTAAIFSPFHEQMGPVPFPEWHQFNNEAHRIRDEIEASERSPMQTAVSVSKQYTSGAAKGVRTPAEMDSDELLSALQREGRVADDAHIPMERQYAEAVARHPVRQSYRRAKDGTLDHQYLTVKEAQREAYQRVMEKDAAGHYASDAERDADFEQEVATITGSLARDAKRQAEGLPELERLRGEAEADRLVYEVGRPEEQAKIRAHYDELREKKRDAISKAAENLHIYQTDLASRRAGKVSMAQSELDRLDTQIPKARQRIRDAEHDLAALQAEANTTTQDAKTFGRRYAAAEERHRKAVAAHDRLVETMPSRRARALENLRRAPDRATFTPGELQQRVRTVGRMRQELQFTGVREARDVVHVNAKYDRIRQMVEKRIARIEADKAALLAPSYRATPEIKAALATDCAVHRNMVAALPKRLQTLVDYFHDRYPELTIAPSYKDAVGRHLQQEMARGRAEAEARAVAEASRVASRENPALAARQMKVAEQRAELAAQKQQEIQKVNDRFDRMRRNAKTPEALADVDKKRYAALQRIEESHAGRNSKMDLREQAAGDRSAAIAKMRDPEAIRRAGEEGAATALRYAKERIERALDEHANAFLSDYEDHRVPMLTGQGKYEVRTTSFKPQENHVDDIMAYVAARIYARSKVEYQMKVADLIKDARWAIPTSALKEKVALGGIEAEDALRKLRGEDPDWVEFVHPFTREKFAVRTQASHFFNGLLNSTKPGALEQMSKVFQRWMAIWKGSVTHGRMLYYNIRNFQDDLSRAFLAGINPTAKLLTRATEIALCASNPELGAARTELIRTMRVGPRGGKMLPRGGAAKLRQVSDQMSDYYQGITRRVGERALTNANGERMTMAELRREAETRGVLEHGFVAGEMNRGMPLAPADVRAWDPTQSRWVKVANFTRQQFSTKTNLLLGTEGVWLKPTGTIARATENIRRVATFLDRWMAGDTLEDAAKMARVVNLDYGDLTKAEREVFRLFMPFYAFTRKVIPSLLSSAVNRPARWSALSRSAEAVNTYADVNYGPDATVRDYIDKEFGFRVGRMNTGSSIWWNPGFSVTSLNPDVGSMFNPLLELPVVAATGYTLINGQAVDLKAAPNVEPSLGLAQLCRAIDAARGKTVKDPDALLHVERNVYGEEHLVVPRIWEEMWQRFGSTAVVLGKLTPNSTYNIWDRERQQPLWEGGPAAPLFKELTGQSVQINNKLSAETEFLRTGGAAMDRPLKRWSKVTGAGAPTR